MTVGTVIFHKMKPMQLGGLPSVLKLRCVRLFYKRKAGLESLLAAAHSSPLALPAHTHADLCGAQQWLLGPGLWVGPAPGGHPKEVERGEMGSLSIQPCGLLGLLLPLSLHADGRKRSPLLLVPGHCPIFFVVFHTLPTPLQ